MTWTFLFFFNWKNKGRPQSAIRDNKLLLDLKEFQASSGDATFGFVDFMTEVGAAVLVLVEIVQKAYQILVKMA